MFEIIVEKKITDKFLIISKYEGFEKALEAELHSKKLANDYLKSKNQLSLDRCSYTVEYQGTEPCDDLQAIAIEKQGYAVVPFDEDTD